MRHTFCLRALDDVALLLGCTLSSSSSSLSLSLSLSASGVGSAAGGATSRAIALVSMRHASNARRSSSSRYRVASSWHDTASVNPFGTLNNTRRNHNMPSPLHHTSSQRPPTQCSLVDAHRSTTSTEYSSTTIAFAHALKEKNDINAAHEQYEHVLPSSRADSSRITK
jgi:hypothetical protein